MNNSTMTKPLGDVAQFKVSIDSLLEKRRYFVSQVLPQLVEGQDFYVIKNKKSLAKGGSEKISSIYGYTASFEQDKDVMKSLDSVRGIVCFICNLSKGNQIVGQGRGASTLAKNDNDPNKTIKMSQKSAYIDAVIRTSGLSDIFTQDLETMPLSAIAEIPKQEDYSEIEESIPTRQQLTAEDLRDQNAITEKQKAFLESLIVERVASSEERERWLAEANSGLSKWDASEMISSFLMAK